MAKHENSIVNHVAQFIKENPGSNGLTIIKELSFSKSAVYGAIGTLSRGGAIENRGGNNRYNPPKYYSIEESVNSYALEQAEKIYAEMLDQHHSVRVVFLASRLEEFLAE